MKSLSAKRWSPYAVGAALGLLSAFAFATADRGLGITTAFESSAALAARGVAPDAPSVGAYFRDHAQKPPKLDWEALLVLGVFAGALLSSLLSRDRGEGAVPSVWRRRFGDSRALRLSAAFGGGVILMFGARLAGGCTSGHGITGTLQLAVSSWVFIALAMATGVATAFTLFGRSERRV